MPPKHLLRPGHLNRRVPKAFHARVPETVQPVIVGLDRRQMRIVLALLRLLRRGGQRSRERKAGLQVGDQRPDQGHAGGVEIGRAHV